MKTSKFQKLHGKISTKIFNLFILRNIDFDSLRDELDSNLDGIDKINILYVKKMILGINGIAGFTKKGKVCSIIGKTAAGKMNKKNFCKEIFSDVADACEASVCAGARTVAKTTTNVGAQVKLFPN